MNTITKLLSTSSIVLLIAGCSGIQNEGGPRAAGVGSTHSHAMPDGSTKVHTHDGDLSKTHTHNIKDL